jgi:hypothetical protein
MDGLGRRARSAHLRVVVVSSEHGIDHDTEHALRRRPVNPSSGCEGWAASRA